MKELIIHLKDENSDSIIQFSEIYSVNKKLYITVPNQYKAIVYIDEKVSFRIEPCIKTSIYEQYGKEYLGKQVRVAFIMAKSLPQMAWGFGNIQVNNEKLKEAYRVGTNGKYIIDIIDYVKLINSFSMNEPITIDKIREKSISAIKTIGIPILSACFANTDTSVFEISSLTGKIRENMIIELKKEMIFSELGIKLNSLTIDGIHVNDEDLEIIRNRING
jgi:membrane protease subunit (stomatin/prohibitin family)